MKDRYSRELLGYFEHPQNAWKDGDTHPDVLVRICGDVQKGEVIRLFLLMDKKKGRIEKCWFQASGSVEAIAIASWVTTFVADRSIDRVLLELEPESRRLLGLRPNQWRVTNWLMQLFRELKDEIES